MWLHNEEIPFVEGAFFGRKNVESAVFAVSGPTEALWKPADVIQCKVGAESDCNGVVKMMGMMRSLEW